MTNYFKLSAIGICFIYLFSSAHAEDSAWFDAVKRGDEWTLSGLLFKGTAVNSADSRGNTAVHLVARAGDSNTLKWLLKQKDVDLNRRNAAGETPLMLALLEGHFALATALLDKNAQVNQVGWTPLHYASASKAPAADAFVRNLVEDHAAYIDAESPNGTTPLMMAAQYGSTESVRALIELGADVEVKNQLGLTALDFARRGERPDAIRSISEKLEKIEIARAKARAEAEAKALAKARQEAQAAALAEQKRLAEERAVKALPIDGSSTGIESRALGAPSEARITGVTEMGLKTDTATDKASVQDGPGATVGGLIAPALALPKSVLPLQTQQDRAQPASEPNLLPKEIPLPNADSAPLADAPAPEAAMPRTPIVVPDTAFGKVIGPAPDAPIEAPSAPAPLPKEPSGPDSPSAMSTDAPVPTQPEASIEAVGSIATEPQRASSTAKDEPAPPAESTGTPESTPVPQTLENSGALTPSSSAATNAETTDGIESQSAPPNQATVPGALVPEPSAEPGAAKVLKDARTSIDANPSASPSDTLGPAPSPAPNTDASPSPNPSPTPNPGPTSAPVEQPALKGNW
jgi:hypothetical protein